MRSLVRHGALSFSMRSPFHPYVLPFTHTHSSSPMWSTACPCALPFAHALSRSPIRAPAHPCALSAPMRSPVHLCTLIFIYELSCLPINYLVRPCALSLAHVLFYSFMCTLARPCILFSPMYSTVHRWTLLFIQVCASHVQGARPALPSTYVHVAAPLTQVLESQASHT